MIGQTEEDRARIRRVAEEIAHSMGMGMEVEAVIHMVDAALANYPAASDKELHMLALNYEYVPTGKVPDRAEKRATKREHRMMQPWRKGHA